MTRIRPTDQAQLFVWSDIDPDHEGDFNQWYDREHMEERVRIEGFTGARRYRAVSGAARRYLALYRASSLADFTSAAYQKAFTKQTQWSVTNFGRMSNTRRRVMHVAQEGGFGWGAALALVELAPGAVKDETLRAVMEGLMAEPGVMRVHYMQPDETLSTPLPSESTEGRVLAPCLAVDVTSEPIAEATLRQLTERFGGAVREAETFRLMWALDEHDLPPLED
ncbi:MULTISPECIES: DUF4286 family protein [Marinovum]|jgi:hypothetical protein|uniref:DUF4286 family protein n=1 Tax=Marinovum TaxID=367771 RepID=UPI00065B2F34|nr:MULTISPECIES: DUF4286 family protein [Marinovum]AKO96347.1 hypothetical protein MALG_01159 [Marinovum algicola DG 898]MDD9743328.1 hypothetical protein [Marinovum sp. PR37]